MSERPCLIEDGRTRRARSTSTTEFKYRRSTSMPAATSSHSGRKTFDRRQRLTLACLALIHFGVYLSMAVIAPFFPFEAELKGMSLATTGYVFSCYALVMVIFSPFAAKLMPAMGVKLSLISGVFLASGCNILFGTLNYIDDTVLFTTFCFALRSVEAVGSTAFFTAAWTTIAEEFPDDVGYIFGIMETFVGLGMMAGPSLGGVLYSLGGYGLPFYSLGTFLMLTIPICILTLRDPCLGESDEDVGVASFLRLLRLPSVLAVCLAVVVLCGIWGFLDPTLEPHVRDFGLTPQTTGTLFLLMGGTYGAACSLVGYLCDRWGHEFQAMSIGTLLTAGCLLAMGPSVVLPSVSSQLWVNVVAIALMGFTLAVGVIPTFQSMMQEAHKGGFPDNMVTYGMISSVFSAASSFGEFLGPAVGGVLFEYYDFDFACTVIAAACVVTALVLAASGTFWHSDHKNLIDTILDDVESAERARYLDSGIFESTERKPLLSTSSK